MPRSDYAGHSLPSTKLLLEHTKVERTRKDDLSPVEFAQLEVYSIAAAPQPPPSALPIGVKLPEDQMASTAIPPSHYPSLSHLLLAVVRTSSASCDDLLDASCAGYVWVQHVDLERQKVQILAPSGLQAPTLRLLAGSIKWSGESFN